MYFISLHNLVSLINRHPSNVTYLERDKNFNFVGFFLLLLLFDNFFYWFLGGFKDHW